MLDFVGATVFTDGIGFRLGQAVGARLQTLQQGLGFAAGGFAQLLGQGLRDFLGDRGAAEHVHAQAAEVTVHTACADEADKGFFQQVQIHGVLLFLLGLVPWTKRFASRRPAAGQAGIGVSAVWTAPAKDGRPDAARWVFACS